MCVCVCVCVCVYCVMCCVFACVSMLSYMHVSPHYKTCPLVFMNNNYIKKVNYYKLYCDI